METLSGKVLGIAEKSSSFLDSLKASTTPMLILDILIVATLFYWGYLFLSQTRAMRILYGLLFLVAIAAIGSLFNLILLNWILKYLMAMLVVAIPVVFQPELRAALEKLGRARILTDFFLSGEHSKAVEEITQAVEILSKQKIGALIVLQRQSGLREYIENGTEINAKIDKNILLSIFFPKSPLHDGAVIIAGDTIVSARSILPVTDASISPELGTRHKAAIGVTEDSDAVGIVVSEETGAVSLAVGGKLERRISSERLTNRLNGLLRAIKN